MLPSALMLVIHNQAYRIRLRVKPVRRCWRRIPARKSRCQIVQEGRTPSLAATARGAHARKPSPTLGKPSACALKCGLSAACLNRGNLQVGSGRLMPALPIISGADSVRVFSNHGWMAVRQRGSLTRDAELTTVCLSTHSTTEPAPPHLKLLEDWADGLRMRKANPGWHRGLPPCCF